MKKYLALDLGGTFLKAAIIDEEVNIVEKWKVPSAHATTIPQMLEVFDEAVLSHLDGVTAIAISLPGRIDIDAGIMRTAGAFNYFMGGFEIVKVLEERYHLPVGIDNDAKCACNAEVWKGALKDCANGLVYVFGTGIGGGIEINHQVYRGSHFSSGEFSGLIMNLQHDIHDSANFMSYDLSTTGLIRRYKDATGLQEVDGELIFGKVNEGDETACRVLREFCGQVVRYFYNLQTCFDADRIAIGGGISAQPALLQYLQEELDKIFEVLNIATVKPELVRCEFSNDANLIGAVKSYRDFHKD